MGTYYGYSSVSNLVEEVSTDYRLVRSKVVKGNLYGVLPDNRGIMVFKLDKSDPRAPGYKPMHETEGPYYYDVPKSWLKLPVLEECEGKAWRDIVRSRSHMRI